MGLATAPTIFQRFINSVLSPFLGKTCFAYLDDIIIFSSVEEHEKHVTEILEALERNDLHLKPKKCAWEQKEVDFLGYTAVAGRGVRMSEDKMEAIRDMEPPKTSGRSISTELSISTANSYPTSRTLCSPSIS